MIKEKLNPCTNGTKLIIKYNQITLKILKENRVGKNFSHNVRINKN